MFWVYENWVAAKKAVVHRGDCGFCHEGAGTGRNVLGEQNGRWHGPFSSFEGAKSAAVGLADREYRECGSCKPG